EARNVDTTWVMGNSTDGTTRGWMEQRFLALPANPSVSTLLFSNEEMFVPPPSDMQTVYTTINLNNYPIIPTEMGHAREIYERGRIVGTDRQTVSKVGDCITDNIHFLSPFGTGEYNLGSYTGLQATISHFDMSLAYNSLAAYDGLVTTAVLDPLFANPTTCQPGETPLRCEFRAHQPSVAIIMFGAQDLLFTPPENFDLHLRRIVHETIQAGVIPILSTFPGNLEHWEQAISYNQIVVQIALDYDVPLMNFWRALYGLPNYGLNADGRHLSLPITTSADLTAGNLQRGYPMRNLVTLQALDAVWRGAMY
ncbi:MAG: SGNH/GDSL hydrolase family protein, partial [Anaerolineae bacterium]|nr:SGNH/GDSL hydrolase family protein [Anaerolineae bacterium]